MGTSRSPGSRGKIRKYKMTPTGFKPLDKFSSVDQKSERFDKNFESEMKIVSEKIPPQINDHGINHVNRVKGISNEVENTLKESGFVEEYLNGEKLTRDDNTAYEIALKYHDIGLKNGKLEGHGDRSAQYVLTNNKLQLNQKIRKSAASIIKMHNEHVSKPFSTNDQNKLLKEKRITRKQALQNSKLILADGLDAGYRRGIHNSQGIKSSVIQKENIRKFGETKGKIYNSHFKGHQAFLQPKFQLGEKKGRFKLILPLRDKRLKNDSRVAAQMIRSTLRKLNHTIFKNKTNVIFSCKNKKICRDWLNKNQDLLFSELKNKKVTIQEM